MRTLFRIGLALAVMAAVALPQTASAQGARAANVLFDSAKTFFDVQNDELASAQFEDFVAKYPADGRVSEAYNFLGRVYQRQVPPAYDKAISAFKLAALKAGDPKLSEIKAEASYHIGECYRNQKQHVLAAKAFTDAEAAATAAKALAIAANNTDRRDSAADLACRAQYMVGQSLYQVEQDKDAAARTYTDALAAFQKVTAIAPAKHDMAAWAYCGIGIIQMEPSRGRFAEAITAFTVVVTSPDYAGSKAVLYATQALGTACMRQGEKRGPAERDAARADLNKAVGYYDQVIAAKEPLDATAEDKAEMAKARLDSAEAQGQAYFDLGKLDPAKPDEPAFAKAGDAYGKALGFAKAALTGSTLATRTMDLHLWRGHALFNAKRHKDAVTEYMAVADTADAPKAKASEALYWSGNSWVLVAKWTAGERARALAEAVTVFKRFLALAGDGHADAARVYLQIAFCYEDQNELGVIDAKDNALDTFKQIIAKWPNTDTATQAHEGVGRLMATGMTLEQLEQWHAKAMPGQAGWSIAIQLSRQYFLKGRPADALKPVLKVLEDNPPAEIAAKAAYLAGACHQRLTQPTDAIPYFQRVVKLQPKDDSVLRSAMRGLTQALLDTKRFAEARDSAIALLKLAFPDREKEMQAEVYMYLAEAYTSVTPAQTADAMTTYKKVAKDFAETSHAASALLGVGWLLEKQTPADRAQAVTTYKDLIARYGVTQPEKMPEANYRLGVNLSELKQYPEAIAALRKVPGTDEKYGDQALYAIAWAYRYQEKHTEANTTFEQVAAKYPASQLAADSFMRIAEYWMKEAKYNEAFPHIKKAYETSKADDRNASLIAFKFGVCAFNTQQYGEAAIAFGKAAGDAGFEAATDAQFWKASSMEKTATQDTAMDVRVLYRQYLEKAPKGLHILDAALGSGRCAFKAGQLDVALQDLQDAQDRCTNVDMSIPDLVTRSENVEPEALYYSGEVYFQKGNYNEAMKQYAGAGAKKFEPWYSKSYLQMARCNLAKADAAEARALPDLARKERAIAQTTLQTLANYLTANAAPENKALLDELKALVVERKLDVKINAN
jgi:tetratricopeptide (TPR) repeat protein